MSAPLAAGYTYSLSSTDTSLRLTLTGCALASREAIHSAALLCRGAVLAANSPVGSQAEVAPVARMRCLQFCVLRSPRVADVDSMECLLGWAGLGSARLGSARLGSARLGRGLGRYTEHLPHFAMLMWRCISGNLQRTLRVPSSSLWPRLALARSHTRTNARTRTNTHTARTPHALTRTRTRTPRAQVAVALQDLSFTTIGCPSCGTQPCAASAHSAQPCRMSKPRHPPAASAQGLGPPLPHLHRDRSARPMPHLHRAWAHPSHICAGTGRCSCGRATCE